jgi:regulator of replication initiation timing
MKEIETSNTKWRKNKKDLDFQLTNVDKCNQEIKEKMQEKSSDIKCVKMEIDNFNQRLEKSKKETAGVKKSFDNKKSASNVSMYYQHFHSLGICEKSFD